MEVTCFWLDSQSTDQNERFGKWKQAVFMPLEDPRKIWEDPEDLQKPREPVRYTTPAILGRFFYPRFLTICSAPVRNNPILQRNK